MSLNSAMLAGVSGLAANSSALAAISDNISNVNTIGYKRSQSDFATIVTSHPAQGTYSAGGVMTYNRQRVTAQGGLQNTSSPTDLAVYGQGFFITTQKPEGVTPTDTRLFTRAGSFTLDSQGYLKNTTGLYLQGWPVDSFGNITTDPSDLTRMSSINVTSVGGTAQPTTRVTLSANLRSSQPVSAAAVNPTTAPVDTNPISGTNPYVVGNLATNFQSNGSLGVKPSYSNVSNFVDANGATHQLVFAYKEDSTVVLPAGQKAYKYEVFPAKASDMINLPASGVLTSGQIIVDTTTTPFTDKTPLASQSTLTQTIMASGSTAAGTNPTALPEWSVPAAATPPAVTPPNGATLSLNLKQAKILEGIAAPKYDPVYNSMTVYNATTGIGVKPDFALQVPVSDSKGGQRTLGMAFLKADQPNTWYAELYAIPASDVETDGAVRGQLMSGIVKFNPNGTIDTVNSTFLPATSNVLNLGASASTLPTTPSAGGLPGTFKWATKLGVDAQNITVVDSLAGGGLTQYDSASVVQQVLTNGTAFGNLTDVQISKDGFVTAIYDNGVSRNISQIGIATFPNPDGLTAISGNSFQVSNVSGTYNLKVPGTGGAGQLRPSTLEASTVDLSTEFTGLITAQRAYSASSKIITTADQMMQELLQIKS